MFRSSSRKRRFGFTLVEVLVTTVVVGVMAAVVIPAVVKQSTAGDPARAVSDLGAVKSAIEIFSQNVRPRMPGDIEDLVNAISTTENGLDGTAYSAANVAKWKGPYLEWTTATVANSGEAVEVFKSGGNAILRSALYRCPVSSSSYSSASSTLPCTLGTGNTSENTSESYAAVRVEGITTNAEFENLNALIDGADEGGATSTSAERGTVGLLRRNASSTIFFLAVPYTQP